MSSAAEESPPTWRKPSDIMRLRRKRKSSTNANLRRLSESSPASSPNTPTEPLPPPWKRPGQKRRNPFGCSPRKRAHIEDHVEDERNLEPTSLFGVLSGSQDKEQIPPAADQLAMQNLDSILSGTFRKAVEKTTDREPEQEEQAEPDVLGEKSCPVDWSVKTKARFISPKPFSWCMQIRTMEESAGLAAFTRNIPDSVSQTIEDPSRCEKSKRAFQKHTLYWQHPNLPWLKLCPRIVPDNKIGKAGSWLINDDIQEALMKDWSESFLSAFSQLRGGKCPYFYMCAHSFTVLFRAGGVGGRSMAHAILTPTSRGFREMLRKEGIEFTMPLAGNFLSKREAELNETKTTASQDEVVNIDKDPKSGDASQQAPTQDGVKLKEDDVDDDITATDDGASSFLADLGLDAARYRSLDPSKIKLQRETYKEIDHRPESMVVIDGSDTQALFNFLLNCRSCFASSGIQTGIPPTLLSPVPFKGATIKYLKYKSASVRQRSATDNSISLWHSLEVEGVFLPHTLHGLTSLFSHTQGEFHATFSTYDATAPLNAAPKDEIVDDDLSVIEKLKESGVQEDHIENITKEYQLGKMAIREIDGKNGLFTWSL